MCTACEDFVLRLWLCVSAWVRQFECIRGKNVCVCGVSVGACQMLGVRSAWMCIVAGVLRVVAVKNRRG